MHRLWSTISSQKHSCCLVRRHSSFICHFVTVHQRRTAMRLVFSIVLPETCNAGAASSCRSDFPLISISMLESGGRTRRQLITLACIIGKLCKCCLPLMMASCRWTTPPPSVARVHFVNVTLLSWCERHHCHTISSDVMQAWLVLHKKIQIVAMCCHNCDLFSSEAYHTFAMN